MVRIGMSRNIVVILRESGPPHALRTVHGRELLGLQVQAIDCTRRDFRRFGWEVSKKQRITIPRPSGKKFVALAVGNFCKRSTICRHDINVRWLAEHVTSECDLLPIRRPSGLETRHRGRSELKSLRS